MQAPYRIVANELSRSKEIFRTKWLAISSLWNTNHDWAPSPTQFPALIKSRKSRHTRLDVNKLVFPYDVWQEYSDALYYHIKLVMKKEGIFPLLTLSWITWNMLQTYVPTLTRSWNAVWSIRQPSNDWKIPTVSHSEVKCKRVVVHKHELQK
jgi:hypothetical protein